MSGRQKCNTAEPLITAPSSFDVKTAVEKLKRYTSPGIDQISAELIQAGNITLYFEIQKLIFVLNKGELPQQCEEYIIVPVYKKGNETVIIAEEYHCYQLHTTFYSVFVSLTSYVGEIIGITSVEFDVVLVLKTCTLISYCCSQVLELCHIFNGIY
jgi:hypothetical protein